jgi:hypothetical protein
LLLSSTKRLVNNLLVNATTDPESVKITRPPTWNRARRKTQLTLQGPASVITEIREYIEITGKNVSCPLTRGYIQFINKEEHLRRELDKINLANLSFTSTKSQENDKSDGGKDSSDKATSAGGS